MIQKVHGIVRGKTIELDEQLDAADGQEVEVLVQSVSSTPADPPPLSAGLAKLYAVLGERYDSGCTDTAARHNEHQP
jgi:hypothetical protein